MYLLPGLACQEQIDTNNSVKDGFDKQMWKLIGLSPQKLIMLTCCASGHLLITKKSHM